MLVKINFRSIDDEVFESVYRRMAPVPTMGCLVYTRDSKLEHVVVGTVNLVSYDYTNPELTEVLVILENVEHRDK